jgi:hypothetical protein
MTVSGYLRNIIYKGSFDGDSVEITMKPVTLGETLDMQGKTTERDIAESLVPLVREHTVSITGLKAADGMDVSIAEVFGSAYFTSLVLAAGMELLKNAAPKNPAQPAP